MYISQDTLLAISTNSQILVSIRNIVAKLSKKSLDKEYYSTKGILYNAYIIISKYQSGSSLESIKLQQHNISSNLHIL